MFHTTTKIFLAAAFLLAGITAASAQMGPKTELKTSVPFSFTVGDQTFPAGDYVFASVTSPGSDSTELVMRGPKGVSMIIDTIPTQSAKAAGQTHLVFNKVAGQYFLAQIWGKGQVDGNEVVRTKNEAKAIAAAAASAGSTSGDNSSADSNK